MNILRQLPLWVCTLLCALVASCIDGHEEFWINADGSGRAEFRYSIPSAAAKFHGGASGIRITIQKLLKETPGLASSNCEVREVSGDIRIHVVGSFDSISDLEKFISVLAVQNISPATEHLAGDVTTTIHGRRFELNRTISPSLAIPGSKWLPTSHFRNRHLTYMIHLPVAAESSNASRTKDHGRTLIWEIPLGQAIKSPVTLHFTARMPLPWYRISAIAIPCGFAIALAGLWWKRRHVSHQAKCP